MKKTLLLLVFLVSLLPSEAQTILNSYAKVTEIAPCNPCLQNCKDIMVDQTTGFSVGDVVMIIQMKGAEISLEADTSFGSVMNYGSAGYHEQNKIAAINGNTITLETGLKANYDVTGSLQIVTVPQFTDYTVTDKIVGKPWDGNSGGIIAFDVSGTLTLQDSIDATGLGFRGAFNPNENFDEVFCGMKNKGDWYFPYSELQVAGKKGEGIASEIPGFELGRGAWANGGGGGHNHNAGGGGGSNVGRGGQGGHEYGGLGCGSVEFIRNGVGGTQLERDGGLRMFLGGGGGAGQENNHNGNSGGDGGGIIIISAGRIEGNGNTIISTGLKGYNYDGIQNAPGGNDGGGGGGAGGSIKLNIPDFGASPLNINADGADGGSLTAAIHGPGGGGGGGLICSTVSSFPSNVTTTVAGGKGGVTNFNDPASWDNWGTTDGDEGEVALSCTPPLFPPTVISVNLGPDVNLCTPPSKVLDTRLDPSLSFEWSKDGTILSEATGPSYLATGPGEYIIKVGGNGCPVSYDTVQVTSNNPTPVDSIFCEDQSVRLEVSGAGNYAWYDSTIAGNKLGEGNFFDTPFLNESTTFYVEDTSTFSYITGAPSTGHGFTDGGPRGVNTIDQQADFLKFDALNDFTLDAIKVQLYGYYCPPASNFTVQVNIFDSDSNLVGSATDTPPCQVGQPTSPMRVELGIDIPAGNGYFLTLDGTKDGQGQDANVMWYQNGATSFPYTITDIISIFSVHSGFVGEVDTAGVFHPGWAPESHPGIFDWEISSGSVCDRVPVQAIKFCEANCDLPFQLEISQDSISICENEQLSINPVIDYGSFPDTDFITTWFKDSDTISAISTNDLTISTVSATDEGWYKIRISDLDASTDSCFIEDSVYVSITGSLEPTVSFSLSPKDTICENTEVTFTATGNGSASANFDWMVNGTSEQNGTSPSFSYTFTETDTVSLSYDPVSSCAIGLATFDTIIVVVPNPDDPAIDQANFSICADTTTLTALAISNGTLNWSVRDGDGASVSEESSNPPIAAVNGMVLNSTTRIYLTATNGSACPDKMDSIDIESLPLPVPKAPDDSTICASETNILLIGNTPAVYETASWEDDLGGPLQSGTDLNIPSLLAGTHTFVYKLSNSACSATDTILLSVDETPVNNGFSQDTIQTCNDSETLNALPVSPSSALGTWSVVSGSASITSGEENQPNASVSGLSTGLNAFEWSVSNGKCPAIKDTVYVEKLGSLSNANISINGGIYSNTDITNDTAALCLGTSYQLNSSSFASDENGVWEILETDNSLSISENSDLNQTPILNSSGTSKIAWIISKNLGGCPADTAFAVININAKPDPSGVINGPSELCEGESANLDLAPVSGAENYLWEVVPGGDATISTQDGSESATIKFNSSTSIIRVIPSNNCGITDTAEIEVQINPNLAPSLSISPDTNNICEGQEIIFTHSGSNEGASPTIKWFINGNESFTSTPFNYSSYADGDVVKAELYPDLTCVDSSVLNINGAAESGEVIILVNAPKKVKVTLGTNISWPVCEDSLLSFNATGINEGANPQYSWFLNNNPVSIGSGTTFSSVLNDKDTLKVRLEVEETCVIANPVSDSMIINLLPLKTIDLNLSGPAEVCEDASITFDALVSDSGTAEMIWYIDNIEEDRNSSSLNSPADLNTGSHEVEVKVISSYACITNPGSEASESLLFTVNPKPDSTVTGTPLFCPDESTELNAVSGYSAYEWFNSGGSIITGNGASDLTVESEDSYYVMITSDKGCVSSSEPVLVEEVVLGTATISSSRGNTICSDESTKLSLSLEASQYEWFKDGVDLMNNVDMYLASETGLYEVVLHFGTCSDTTDFDLQVVPAPTPSFVDNSALICESDNYTIETINSGGNIKWYKNGSPIPTSGAEYIASEAGVYQISEDNGVCIRLSESFMLETEKVPGTNAGPDLAVSEGELIHLHASGAHWYEWQPASKLDNPSTANPLAFPDSSENIFIVTGHSLNYLCSSTDTVIVYVEKKVRPWNSFSPNSDGVYDTWIIENIENFPNATLEIYNRWGMLVWKSRGYSNGGKAWQGENYRNGELLPVATYYYVIYPNGRNINKPLTGDVTIVK